MRLPVLISACLWLATTSLFAKEPEFSRSRDLPPLKLAAADLDTILQNAHLLIAAVNGPLGEQESARESVKLGAGGKEIEIPHFSLASNVAFPREVFMFSYNYYRPDKSISSVTVDMSDYSRRITVIGRAADEVEALSKLLEKGLRRYSIPIGGARFRHLTGMCLSVVLLTSLAVSGTYWWTTRCGSALRALICSIIGLLLLLLVPWDRYLPGFALYQGYSPFIVVRYAPQIFLLGLFAALAGIPLSYFLARRRGNA